MTTVTFSPDTQYKLIVLNEKGAPIIAGTTMKVVELVMAQWAHGWSPEELQFQYPHLSMSQIHSALAYYWEHKDALDADIEQRRIYAEQMRQANGPSPLAHRLRQMGLLE